jgi:hypothetical protein
MYLDTLIPSEYKVGHGGIGSRGGMGYPILLSVNKSFFEHSISAHPNSKLKFEIHEGFNLLSCHVALNDSSVEDSEANFFIYADGILVGAATNVRKNCDPRFIEARIYNPKKIELIIESDNPHGCHAVWIDPVLHASAPNVMMAALNRVHILVPRKIKKVKRCICAVADDSMADMLSNFLASLYKYGNVRDCHVVVMTEENSVIVPKICRKFGADTIEIKRVVDDVNIWIKTAVYSIAHVVCADQYLVFDTDILVIGDVRNLFNTMDSCNDLAILAGRENWISKQTSVEDILDNLSEPYGGQQGASDFLNLSQKDKSLKFIINGGVFGGSRKSMLALDNMMRSMAPMGIVWMDQRIDLPWREQALLNAAIAKMGCVNEIDEKYNMQLLKEPENLQIHVSESNLIASIDKKTINVLHFNGKEGKEKYNKFSSLFSNLDLGKFGNVSEKWVEEYIEFVVDYAREFDQEENVFNAHIFKNILDSDSSIRHVASEISRLQPLNILDINTYHGAVGGVCLKYSEINNTEYQRIQSSGSQLIAKLSKKYKNDCIENVFVECKKINDLNKKYDIIIMDTSENDKNTSVLILLASNMLNDNGIILVHDKNNPLCNMDSVARKLRINNLKISSNNDYRSSFDAHKVHTIERM